MAEQPSQRSLQLTDQWIIEYQPTLPTEFADIYDPSRPWLRLPHTAEFQWRMEADSIEPGVVRATFGVHGWVTSSDGTRRPRGKPREQSITRKRREQHRRPILIRLCAKAAQHQARKPRRHDGIAKEIGQLQIFDQQPRRARGNGR